MSGFYIEVDKDDLKYVQKKFREAPQKAKRVLRNAINQTATQTNRKLKKGRSAGYTISAGAFNSEIQIQRANLGHLDATIKSHGRPRTIQQFKHSVEASAASVTKGGMKSIINSAGCKSIYGYWWSRGRANRPKRNQGTVPAPSDRIELRAKDG